MSEPEKSESPLALALQILTLLSGVIITVITLLHRNRLEMLHAVNTS